MWAKELNAIGIKRQQNSLLFASPPLPVEHVIYFQGDVQVTCIWCPQAQSIPPPHTCTQNTHNAMTAQPPEVAQWQKWCLEHTCTMLQCSFPAAAVWIVRPSRMLRQMFSCFHNFVQSSLIGVPIYNTTYGCLLQLEALLKDSIQNAIRKGHLDMSSTYRATS